MRLLAGMLGLSPWRYLPLTLHIATEGHAKTFRGEPAAAWGGVGRCVLL
jgi:hypothetical protein